MVMFINKPSPDPTDIAQHIPRIQTFYKKKDRKGFNMRTLDLQFELKGCLYPFMVKLWK